MNKKQINLALDKAQQIVDNHPDQLLSYADAKKASAKHLSTLKSNEIAEAKSFSYATV